MQSPMTVRRHAVAVVVAAALPMAVAMAVVVELLHLCGPTKAMAMAVLAHLRRLLSVPQLQPLLWKRWRKWLHNRLLRKLLPRFPQSRRCLEVAPVAVVLRRVERRVSSSCTALLEPRLPRCGFQSAFCFHLNA